MDQPTRPWALVLLRVASVGAVVIGLGLVLVAVTIGDCAAFGGSCPSEPPSLIDDDVFGMSAFGAFIATATPVFAAAPSRRRLAISLGTGALAGLVVGLIARSVAAG